jgi:hypothetical protein
MMSEKVTFSAFDPILFDVPACDVCASQPPMFHYEYAVDEGIRQQPRKGFCCRSCAAKLLDILQRAESQVWAEKKPSSRLMMSTPATSRSVASRHSAVVGDAKGGKPRFFCETKRRCRTRMAASSRQPPFHQEVLTPFVDCLLILGTGRETRHIT